MSKNSNEVYVSFIKINGRSILPPLLDNIRKEEMRQYRELAISIGLRMKERDYEKEKLSHTHNFCETVRSVSPDEEREQLSPTLTASTDLNQFLDSTLDTSQLTNEVSASSGRLIRSTSYTLDQPSVSLLTAVEQANSFNIESHCALKKKSKPPKKVVTVKRKKKLLASSRLLKSAASAKTKQLVRNSCVTESKDFHLDLNVHVDAPSSLIGTCFNNCQSAAAQTTPSNNVSTEIKTCNDNSFPLNVNDIQDSKNFLNLIDACNNNDDAHNEVKTCSFSLLPDELIDEIIEKDLISFESDVFEDEQNSTEVYKVHNVFQQSQFTPHILQVVTATQTDLSPTNHDDISRNLFDVDFHETVTHDGCSETLSTVVANIQLEYEMKLNALMKQQEMEKQRLKEQFLHQQELLFQKLTISNTLSHRSTLANVPSPPIHQHRGEIPTARKLLSKELCQKFARLPALVRGYLTRRLMQTERIQNIKSTVRETLSLAVHLHAQPPPLHPTDIALHGRLIQQLDQALAELHDIFFALPLDKRLHIIAVDRERLQKGSSSVRSSSGSRVSSATLKSQQRRQQRNSYSSNIGSAGDITHNTASVTRHSIPKHNVHPFHLCISDASKQNNREVKSEIKARRHSHSDRQSSNPKSKQPWR